MTMGRTATVVGLALVLVLGGLVVIDHHQRERSDPDRPATGTAVTTTTAGSVPGMASMDIFGNRLESAANEAGAAVAQDPAARPDPRSPDYLSAAPSGVTWQRGWGGAALGVSRSDGPRRIEDGVATGYADTPQGAALAAYDALGRSLAAPDGVWQRVVTQRFVTSDSHGLIARFGRSRAATPEAAKYVVVPDGLRVLSGYAPDFAAVQIAIRGTNGWGCATWPMVWTGNDWKVRTPDDPQDLWSTMPLISLTGFGAWK